MKIVHIKNIFLVFISFFVVGIISNNACDYHQVLEPYKYYDIYSPNFSDGLYMANSSCRWVADAPDDTFTVLLNCVLVDLPSSTQCMGDRIEISETGRLDLADARRYCGKGQILFETSGDRLVMNFKAAEKSKGGRFFCTIQAVEDSCDCGRKDRTKIVGGIKTKMHEFPMMAGLVNLNSNRAQNMVFCGATIISTRHLLTAAHCFAGQKLRNLLVLVGDDNTTSAVDTPYTATYRIAQVTLHPEFVFNEAEHDIAIVKTFDTIEFNEGVNVVCLPFKFATNDFANEIVEVLGWGTMEFSGPKAEKLMKVKLSVITNEKCLERGMNVNDTNLCTYSVGKDSCQYDSGGPLLFENSSNDRMYLVGIVSRGKSCASKYPSVNVRVTKYLNWIVRSTAGAKYCKK